MLWEADCDDTAFVRVVVEMIASARASTSEFGDVVLQVNNVTVEPDEHGEVPHPGDYVAITVSGSGFRSSEMTWTLDDDTIFVNADLDTAARTLGVRWAYTRPMPTGGSTTIFVPRLT